MSELADAQKKKSLFRSKQYYISLLDVILLKTFAKRRNIADKIASVNQA